MLQDKFAVNTKPDYLNVEHAISTDAESANELVLCNTWWDCQQTAYKAYQPVLSRVSCTGYEYNALQYPLTSRSRWQCRLMRVLQFFTSPWNDALASSMGTVRWPTPASSVTQMEWMFILRDSPWGTSGMTDWVTFSSSSSRNQSFRSCRLRRSHRSCGTGLSSSSGVSATGLSADWMVITVFMMMGDTLGNKEKSRFFILFYTLLLTHRIKKINRLVAIPLSH